MAVTKKSTKISVSEDKDKKVFDVAKPGSSDPDTGTKPMVIGHKAMASDPSMVEKKEVTDEEELEPKIQVSPSSKKLTLQPLTSEEKDGESQENQSGIKATPTDKDDEVVKEEKTTNNSEKNDVEAITEEEPDVSKTADELEKEHQATSDEREAKLNELIKSGEYKVSINESKSFDLKVFALAMLAVLLVLGVILIALIDLEILDSGLTLPFDLL